MAWILMSRRRGQMVWRWWSLPKLPHYIEFCNVQVRRAAGPGRAATARRRLEMERESGGRLAETGRPGMRWVLSFRRLRRVKG